jgi:hypothetical protein
MSETHFHVHGPHEHELDHAAQGAHADAGHGTPDLFSAASRSPPRYSRRSGRCLPIKVATQTNAALFKTMRDQKDRGLQSVELLLSQESKQNLLSSAPS